MQILRVAATCLAAAMVVAAPMPADAIDVTSYVGKDRFETIKLSPTGEYYAVTIPMEKETILAIRRRSDHKVTGSFGQGSNVHVHDFWWVNPERVVISIAERFGSLDQPMLTGELYAMNANGGNAEILVGQRLVSGQLGTRLGSKKKEERVAALMIDDLPGDGRNVLIDVFRFIDDPESRVEKMDVYTGKRNKIIQGPVANVTFTSDNSGAVRFAHGGGIDLVSRLYYRSGDGTDWKLVNDQVASGRVERALGFSEDNRTAYLQVEHEQGPDAIVAVNLDDWKRRELLRDDDTDPMALIYRPGTSIPIGATYMDGKPRMAFFDDASADARLYRSLEVAFKGQMIEIISTTADGKLALVQTSSDRSPGDVYTFDLVAKTADYLVSRRDKIDPALAAEVRPISLKARDGLALHGYLTVPNESDGKELPMVVIPHGGPFGEYDKWEFNPESQMLAAAGYAVLQVNFRGSGNHGRSFLHAGAREWGGRMQDDVTDATRWAIEQGYANPARVCIYGASYGGYAALMGAAREPSSYKCAVGYSGVYDLPTMHTQGDIQRRRSGEAYLSQWLGPKEALATVSPNRMADRIKVPVFLAAGGEDQRAPIEHSRKMEKALKSAGVPVETLYYPNEGHGFYVEANRREFYVRLLAFLNRHIGGATATATAAK